MSKRQGTVYVTIDAERCKGCGLCIFFCPKKIITQAEHCNQKGYVPAAVIQNKTDKCTGCIACALMCPDSAVSVYRRSKAESC